MKKNKTIIFIGIFITGFLLAIYPIISNLIHSNNINSVVSTYDKSITTVKDNTKEEILQKAKLYNDNLYQANLPFSNVLKNEDEYLNTLNIGNGIMGKIEIPSINVNLPIYHTTTDEVLSVGVGHLEGSSLPIGTNNSHSVLTSHRGLASSKLFTRLDELKKGDLFYINVLDKTLAYEVKDIQVITPDETQVFNIQDNKDLVSLMTCTPYGINTHRLVVTGERVPFEKQVKEEIKTKPLGFREVIFTTLPFLFLISLITIFIIRGKKKKYEKTN